MRSRAVGFAMGFVMTFAGAASESFAQVQAVQNRSPQQVVINGQLVNGAFVTAAGGQLQSFTCSMPQQYTMPDGSSTGWACYEQTTGVWLLNALPPAQAQTAPVPVPAPAPVQPPPPVYQQQQPPVYQQQQPPVYQQQQPPVYQQQQPPVYQQQQPPVYQQQQPPVYQQQPVYQQAPPPPVIYQQAPPTVIYQQAPPPTVVYQAPPTVIYQQPAPTTVVYTPTPTVPVVVAPAYPSSVVLGTAAIQAAGRIASAAIFAHDHPRVVYRDVHEYHDGRGRHWGWRN
jgi:hypothetical protein